MAGHDAFSYGVERVEWFERTTLEPVDPGTIRDRLADGEVLRTVDVPDHLDRGLVVEAGTGLALYRLVQLFGTPNLPGLEAGGPQPDRERTTWQYLFRVTHEPETDGEDSTTALVSVYDYRTDVSVGISTWTRPDEVPARQVPEPSGEGSMPDRLDEEFLFGVVQLVLHTIEDPVQATFEGLWL